MLTVTKAALDAISEHLCQQNIDSAIRITMMGGCCIGENLRFTLGEMQPDDQLFLIGGLTFVVDRSLSERCGRIQVDFSAEYDHCPCSGHNGGFSISGEHCSFRCCAHSLHTGGSRCWDACPADCVGRLFDAYDHDEELLPQL